MESITKNRQPEKTLRAMAERAYGPGQVPAASADWVSELGDGWFNVAYRLRLRDGTRVVLKVAPPPGVEVLTYERGAMATELAALRLIREHTAVPVPAVHFADRSRELCDADYFFMDYVDADNLGITGPALPAAERDAYHEAVGAANRELNLIRGPAFGPLTGVADCTRPVSSTTNTAWASASRSATTLAQRRALPRPRREPPSLLPGGGFCFPARSCSIFCFLCCSP